MESLTQKINDVVGSLKNSVYPSKEWRDMIRNITHRDVAHVYFTLFTSQYKYCKTALQWYKLNPNNTYTKAETFELNTKLDVLRELVIDYSFLITKARSAEEFNVLNIKEDDIKYFKDNSNTLQNKLGLDNFRNGVIKQLTDLFMKENFTDTLDSNKYLYAFNDKVVDLDNIIVTDDGTMFHDTRPIMATDYIETTTGYDFPEVEPETIEDVKKFIFDLFKTPDEAEFCLKTMAYMLLGDKSKCDYFFVWYGAGGNGKSTLCELLEKVYGNYYSPIDISIFTGSNKENAGQAQPQLANKKGKRAVITTEPERDDKLNVSKFKKLSDTMETRQLYKNCVKFKAQFGVIILTNELPTFTSYDDGLIRRFVAQSFPFRFCQNPRFDNEKLIDVNLKVKINTDDFRDGLIHLLLEYFLKLHVVEDGKAVFKPLEIPKGVQHFTEECRNDNDLVGAFLKGFVVKVDEKMKQKMIEDHFKNNPKSTNKKAETHYNALTRHKTNEIYEIYKNEMFGSQKPNIDLSTFGKELKKRGFKKNNKETHFIDIIINTNDDQESSYSQKEFECVF